MVAWNEPLNEKGMLPLGKESYGRHEVASFSKLLE
jgi:hypothetical protein